MEPRGSLPKLTAKFPEQRFEECKLPSFLQEIIQIEEDIILCYNLRTRVNMISILPENIRSFSVLTEPSNIGNPLELPSCMEESMFSMSLLETIPSNIESKLNKNSIHYSPLTSPDALKVKNFYNLNLFSPIPIVILCEGEIKLVENNELKSVNRVLHCSMKSGEWKTSCWSDYYKMESSSIESLEKLCKNHLEKAFSLHEKKRKYDLQIKSKVLLSRIDDINEISETCCIVYAQLLWSRFSVKPPLDNSKVSLLVDINLSCAPSVSLAIIWRQLVLLQTYMDFLRCSENISESFLPSGKSILEEFGLLTCELSEDNIDTEMSKILYEPIGCMISLSTKDHITLAKLTNFFADPHRPPADLTHALWKKLIGCDSHKLLQMSFKHFIKHVKSSTKSNLIKKSNLSRLAHSILSDQMLLDSCIRLIKPVEYLIEIGIEKLLHTLLAVFDSIKVPSSSLNMPSLPRFSEITNSKDWMEVSESWLGWLSRIYSSLNILYCVEMALGNPRLTEILPIVNNVVSQLCGNDDNGSGKIVSLSSIIKNPQHTVTLKIPTYLFNSSSADTEFFEEWSLTLKSSSNSRKVTSIFYRSPVCPFPYISDENTNNEGGDRNNETLENSTFTTDTTVDLSKTICLSNINKFIHCVDSHKVSDCFPLQNK